MASKEDWDSALAEMVARYQGKDQVTLLKALMDTHMQQQRWERDKEEDRYGRAGHEILRGVYGGGVPAGRVKQLLPIAKDYQGELAAEDLEDSVRPSLMQLLFGNYRR